MTTLAMRYINGQVVVTGPDIEPVKFKSRREGKDWCQTHYPGSPVTEIGANAVMRGGATYKATLIMSPDDPLAKAHQKTARVKSTGTVRPSVN
jgi:hypothetical protein